MASFPEIRLSRLHRVVDSWKAEKSREWWKISEARCCKKRQLLSRSAFIISYTHLFTSLHIISILSPSLLPSMFFPINICAEYLKPRLIRASPSSSAPPAELSLFNSNIHRWSWL
jgi:hypothetical protein